jgi:hypothetical protein
MADNIKVEQPLSNITHQNKKNIELHSPNDRKASKLLGLTKEINSLKSDDGKKSNNKKLIESKNMLEFDLDPSGLNKSKSNDHSSINK